MLLTQTLFLLASLASLRGSSSPLLMMGSTFLLLESQGLFFSLSSSTPLNTNAFTMDKLASSLCFLVLLVVIYIELAPQTTLSTPLGLSGNLAVLALILSLAFTSATPLFFYTMFEASLIPISLMILGWGYQPERLSAVMAMMLYTMLASLPLLLMLMFLSTTGQMSFYSNSELGLSSTSTAFWLTSCAFLAFLVKLPMFAVHLWLPKAHVEAPVSGSMFLAALLLKLGGFGIWRMLSLTTSSAFSPNVQSFALLGGASISFLCLRQTDIKVLIAYSSVAHMSLALACLLSPSSLAMSAGLFMLLAHGISSSAMFGAANLLYLQFNSRNMLLMGGSLSILPSFSLFWFLIIAANMAAPPSANLIAEICSAAYLVSSASIAALTFGVISFLAAAYSLLLYASPLQGQRESSALSSKVSRPVNFLFLLLHVSYFVLLLCFF